MIDYDCFTITRGNLRTSEENLQIRPMELDPITDTIRIHGNDFSDGEEMEIRQRLLDNRPKRVLKVFLV